MNGVCFVCGVPKTRTLKVDCWQRLPDWLDICYTAMLTEEPDWHGAVTLAAVPSLGWHTAVGSRHCHN